MSELEYVVCPQCAATNRVPRAKLAAGGKCGACRAPLFQAHPVDVDHGRFLQHLNNGTQPLLVDFWAAWCGPCKMMAPVFAQAAQKLEPEVRLLKVNTEQEQTLAGELGIRSIPTLALFRGGREVARTAGAMDLPALLAWVRQAL